MGSLGLIFLAGLAILLVASLLFMAAIAREVVAILAEHRAIRRALRSARKSRPPVLGDDDIDR